MRKRRIFKNKMVRRKKKIYIYIYIYLYFMFHIKLYRSKYIYIYIYTVTPFTKLNDLAVHKIKSNSERDEIY